MDLNYDTDYRAIIGRVNYFSNTFAQEFRRYYNTSREFSYQIDKIRKRRNP